MLFQICSAENPSGIQLSQGSKRRPWKRSEILLETFIINMRMGRPRLLPGEDCWLRQVIRCKVCYKCVYCTKALLRRHGYRFKTDDITEHQRALELIHPRACRTHSSGWYLEQIANLAAQTARKIEEARNGIQVDREGKRRWMFGWGGDPLFEWH